MLEPAVLQMQMEKTSSCEALAPGEVHTVSSLGKLVLGQEGGSAPTGLGVPRISVPLFLDRTLVLKQEPS